MSDNPVDIKDVQYLADTLTPAQIRSDINTTREYIKDQDSFYRLPCEILWNPQMINVDGIVEYDWLNPDGVVLIYKHWSHDYKWWLNTLRAAQSRQRANTPPPAPFTTKFDVAAIKEGVDILEVAERYTTMRKSGCNFVGSCPLHEDKHPSFFVYPDKQTWQCYQCNRGGDVISLVMAVDNMDFRSAALSLRNR